MNVDFNKELKQIALAMECAREFEILPHRYHEVSGTAYAELELATLAQLGGKTLDEIVQEFTGKVLGHD